MYFIGTLSMLPGSSADLRLMEVHRIAYKKHVLVTKILNNSAPLSEVSEKSGVPTMMSGHETGPPSFFCPWTKSQVQDFPPLFSSAQEKKENLTALSKSKL